MGLQCVNIICICTLSVAFNRNERFCKYQIPRMLPLYSELNYLYFYSLTKSTINQVNIYVKISPVSIRFPYIWNAPQTYFTKIVFVSATEATKNHLEYEIWNFIPLILWFSKLQQTNLVFVSLSPPAIQYTTFNYNYKKLMYMTQNLGDRSESS